MEADIDNRGPGLKYPPPVIPVGVIAVAWLLDVKWPLPILPVAGWWLFGAALVAASIGILLIALRQFRQAGTSVEPWQPTTVILQHGIYGWSRNPIYLAFCVYTFGLGLWLDSAWIVLATLPVAALLQRLVIRREEAYLAEKFGDAYLDYCRRVRRWF